MPLSLEQYATWLDSRSDLLWPAPPTVKKPKAKPHLKPLPQVRAVTFNVYGTLLAIGGGQLLFVHPQPFIMENALEKTIQEFKMWQSMSRKPGKPSEYMGRMYQQLLDEAGMACASQSERHPEVRCDDVWERIVKRLMKNDYTFDTGFYGSLNQFCERIAYFFQASLQGTGPQDGALATLTTLQSRGLALGLVADGQCFTPLQLLRGLRAQGKLGGLVELFPDEHIALSYAVRARRPSERLFRAALASLPGVDPGQVLHIGSDLGNDVAPAKRLGMQTGLFAGDQDSLVATQEQLKTVRPDILITDLPQLLDVLKP
jgi:FMN phosphatase YigB (HAD superfamily)